MAQQRCPNCSARNDVGVFVSGQQAVCSRCGLRFTVERDDVTVRRPQGHATTQETPARPGEAEQPLPEVPGYRVSALIGRGGMGQVFRATQASLGREVALKLLAPELSHQPEFVKRFEKEAAALAQLDHPGIVRIIDQGRVGELPYLAMAWVDGPTLRKVLAQGRLEPGEALAVARALGKALVHAHGRGVIHRDLKPENVLLGPDGAPCLADFGLAALRDERFDVTRTAMTMGTIDYMAPEQRRDAKSVDARADLYSLAALTYELLCGEPPLGKFRMPSERLTGLDPRIDAVLARALEQEPKDRQPDVATFLDELEPLGANPSDLSTLVRPSRAAPSNAPTPEGPRTLAASPRALGLSDPRQAVQPPLPAQLQSRLGPWMQRLVLGAGMLFLGLLALWVFAPQWIRIDEYGLRVGRVNVARKARRDAGAIDIPRDTDGDVAVALLRKGDPAFTRLDGDLTQPASSAGAPTFIAFDGTWQATARGLEARVFDRYQADRDRPRATLEEPAFRFEGLSLEARMQADATPPTGFVARTPELGLFFHAEDAVVQLVMSLGDAPQYQLRWKFQASDGKTESGTSGDADFVQLVPTPGKPVVLGFKVKKGTLLATADGKPIFGQPLQLPKLAARRGRVGLLCEEASCRFDGFSASGRAESQVDLGDDHHAHTLAEASPLDGGR